MNEELGTASAEFCFDSDCVTVAADSGPGDVFSGFNVNTWEEGRTVDLRITVFDAEGIVLDTLPESRTMDSSRCACGVLYYDWQDGRLHRLN